MDASIILSRPFARDGDLDGLQDPGNAGAILRAAEAFGATGVVFLKGTVSPYNPKCLRASAGSIFRIPLVAALRSAAVLAAAEQRKLVRSRRHAQGRWSRRSARRNFAENAPSSSAAKAAASANVLRCKATATAHSDRRRGIAQRGAGRRDRALCGARSGTAWRRRMSLFEPDPLASVTARRSEAPAGRADAPGHARRLRRAAAHPRPRQAAARADRARPADFDHPVGTARRRQDHAGAASSPA